MLHKTKSIIILIFLFATYHIQAQSNIESLLHELIEQWADQNEEEDVPDDMIEILQDLMDNPVNINDTSSDILYGIPFLSDYQRAAIKAYIAQNGPMQSLSELHLINGFDSLDIRLLNHLVTVKKPNEKKSSLANMIKNGHSNLRMGGKSMFPKSRGYNEDIYVGSPLRLYFRYNFKYHDNISFQLSGDKDPGEAIRFANVNGASQMGFDHYGYHLMISDFGFIKRAIVGKYNLQFGQGATLWSGFAPWMTVSMPLRRYGQGIRPSSAMCEFGYLRGAAATFNVIPEKLEMTLFYSNVNRDATEKENDTLYEAEEIFQSFYNSGYHRTNTEIAKKGRINEQLFGTNIRYKNRSLQIGATAVRTLLGSEIVPADYIYNTFAFKGKDNFNYGIDMTWRYRRMILFGEASSSLMRCRTESTEKPFPITSVAGMQLQLNSDNMISIALRHSSPTYQNLYANIIGQSSKAQNEQGITLFINTKPLTTTRLQSSVDLFRFPWMKYRVYSPSSGVDYRTTLTTTVATNTLLSVQYRSRYTQRNSDGQEYAIENTTRRQLALSLDYTPDNTWRITSRVLLSWFDCDDHIPQNGIMIIQDVAYKTIIVNKPLSMNCRLSIFDITGYDARIFSYENDLMYENSVPMFNGRGIRCYYVCRYEFTPSLSAGIKYSVSFYPEQETLGSGYDLINGNAKHEVKAQLRLKF
ncbi:MAG: hypothetical protein J6X58_01710 [Bacteroidales bacterium]|nr:hypothetical protein [Bacteroidales bacterium]